MSHRSKKFCKHLKQGKNIFMTHCTSCHNSKLALDMTGPALGNITHFRDSAFLVDFTRNSQGMIRSGDTLANCIYYQWNGFVLVCKNPVTFNGIRK